MTRKRAARTRVAFIGLGTMGLPMARNLAAAGYRIVGHDLDPRRAAEAGGDVALSPAEAAGGADVVIASLPSPAAVESVAFGPGGVHGGIAAGATFIDMSTNAPARARDLAARFAEIGVGALDAPVSGGPAGAAEATLSIMVGGDAELFTRWLPLLRTLGRHVVRVGDSGAGQVAKLCNNQIAGATMAAISEACAVAAAASVDAGILYELLCNSTGDSRVLRTRFPLAGAGSGHPADNGYTPLFTLDLLLKDLRLALELAEGAGATTPLLRTVVDRYDAARAAGYGPLDYSAVYLLHGDAPED
jgi:3-hydroxyisobutyrate dehydrogenase